MTSCSPERNGNYVKFRCEHCKQFTLCFYGKLLNKSRTGYVFNERKSILDHEDNCNGCYTIDTLGCMFERGLINSILKNRCEKTGRRKLTTLYLQEECKVRDGSLVSTDIIKKLSSKLLNPVKKTRKARNEEDGEDGADSDSEAEDEAGLSSTRQEAEGEVEEVAGSRANNKKRPRKAAAASSSTGKGKGRGKKAQPVVAESSSDSERDSVIEAEL